MSAPDLSHIPHEDKAQLLTLLKEKDRRESLKNRSVIGLVGMDGTLKKSLLHVGDNEYKPTTREPDVYLPEVLAPMVGCTKRFIILIGGRGSTKSVSGVDYCLIDARDNLGKTYCLREYQSSIKASIHSLITDEIKRLEFPGFGIMKAEITYQNDTAFDFAGLSRNVDSIKSAHGFKKYLIEEAQFISEDSLQALTPTARNKPNKGLPRKIEPGKVEASNVQFIFIANPGSSEDPFSKRFIVPYLSELNRSGIYQDDLHLIIKVNYDQNPWFHESGLEVERRFDYENKSRASYDHTWLGEFNDHVDDSLIMREWFDACIDAHKRLGFEPTGALFGAHDPSDEGSDSKGYAMRHGVVVLDVQEKTTGNVNEGGHWAAQIAIEQGVDHFTWDGDGMGSGLSEQNSRDFKDKGVNLAMFKGSEGPDFPEAIYMPARDGAPVRDQKTNKDSFRNKRAQYYFELRDRIYRTYRAVIHGEYADPDTLISFSSDMALLDKLRSELCKMPKKPNTTGKNELYTKEVMRVKFKLPSPNLADSVMMLMRMPPTRMETAAVMPRPIPTIRTK